MRVTNIFLRGLALVVALAGMATSSMAQTVSKGAALSNDCAAEISSYCSNVTPGDDRVVSCLLAYEDKVSARCRLTAYLASGNLGVRLKRLQSLSKTCSSDILQYCSKIPPGGGRIYDCLKGNKATLTDACRGIINKAGPL
jgi:Cysteine rich repeat